MLTIISGGQSGVDQIALQVAWELGFPTGGTAPLGYRHEYGVNFQLRDVYGLKESWSPGYRVRTIQNVSAGEATVWFGDETSPGGILTIGTCVRLSRLHWINPTIERLYWELTKHRIQVLNVAGNRASTNPAAWQQAEIVLRAVLTQLRDAQARQARHV